MACTFDNGHRINIVEIINIAGVEASMDITIGDERSRKSAALLA
jgi:hypothetical protein